VLQETMVALMRLLPKFVYDRRKGKFRNFLLTIVHRQALGALRRVARRAEVKLMETKEADSQGPFAGDRAGEAEAQMRWRESLMEEAIRRVRSDSRLDDRTFAVFEAYAIQQCPVAVVAERFGLKENAVYQIKNRVLRRLRAEAGLMLRNSGTESPLNES
jgi:RNA polymerase sigma-70 factor (ECF subfamily)